MLFAPAAPPTSAARSRLSTSPAKSLVPPARTSSARLSKVVRSRSSVRMPWQWWSTRSPRLPERSRAASATHDLRLLLGPAVQLSQALGQPLGKARDQEGHEDHYGDPPPCRDREPLER